MDFKFLREECNKMIDGILSTPVILVLVPFLIVITVVSFGMVMALFLKERLNIAA